MQRCFPCFTTGNHPGQLSLYRCILGLSGGWPINKIYVTLISKGCNITVTNKRKIFVHPHKKGRSNFSHFLQSAFLHPSTFKVVVQPFICILLKLKDKHKSLIFFTTKSLTFWKKKKRKKQQSRHWFCSFFCLDISKQSKKKKNRSQFSSCISVNVKVTNQTVRSVGTLTAILIYHFGPQAPPTGKGVGPAWLWDPFQAAWTFL